MNRGKAYQVGIDRITLNGKRKYFLYKDCIPTKNDWYDTSYYLPHPFDLCFLEMDNVIKIGWWTGENWYGNRINEKDKVYYWKLNQMDF